MMSETTERGMSTSTTSSVEKPKLAYMMLPKAVRPLGRGELVLGVMSMEVGLPVRHAAEESIDHAEPELRVTAGFPDLTPFPFDDYVAAGLVLENTSSATRNGQLILSERRNR